MYRVKVEKLQGLRRNFNIFIDSPAVSHELVREGLIPPLPLIHDYLVWGFPYLEEAAKQEIEELYCISLGGGMGDALVTALLLENRTDRYSWSEKRNLLNLLREFPEIEPDETLLSLVQREGSFLPLAESFLHLPDYIQEAVDAGEIDLKTGKKAAFLSETSFSVLRQLFGRLSFSVRRQLLEMFTELTKKEEMTAAEIENFAERLFRSGDPLNTVKTRRYPQLSEMEETLRSFRERYINGTGIELIPPPQFEGNGYTLRFSWKSERQLEKVIESLQRLKQNGNELFKLLY